MTDRPRILIIALASTVEVGTVQYSTAKAIATSDLITTVTPEKKAEEEKAEEEEEKTNVTEASEPAPSTPVKYDTKVRHGAFPEHSSLRLFKCVGLVQLFGHRFIPVILSKKMEMSENNSIRKR